MKLRSFVDKALECLIITLMAVMVANVLWQVFTRYVLNNPSSYTEELARFLLIWLGLLGASYGVSKKTHLAIDILKTKLREPLLGAVELFVHSAILLFGVLVLVVGGLRLVHMTLTLGQTSAALQIQIGYVYWVLPLSGILIAFYSGLAIFEQIRKPSTEGPSAGPPGQGHESEKAS